MTAVRRRAVLLAGACAVASPAVAACTDDPVGSPPGGPDPARSTSTQETAVFDLSFTLESRYRPFELVAPAFVAVDEAEASATP